MDAFLYVYGRWTCVYCSHWCKNIEHIDECTTIFGQILISQMRIRKWRGKFSCLKFPPWRCAMPVYCIHYYAVCGTFNSPARRNMHSWFHCTLGCRDIWSKSHSITFINKFLEFLISRNSSIQRGRNFGNGRPVVWWGDSEKLQNQFFIFIQQIGKISGRSVLL